MWPKIKAHKPLHAVDRDFIFSEVAPYLSHYRMFKKDGAYIFTNALGDSFRYRP